MKTRNTYSKINLSIFHFRNLLHEARSVVAAAAVAKAQSKLHFFLFQGLSINDVGINTGDPRLMRVSLA